MDNLWFQKTTIIQLQYINIQQILVVAFEFTGAARGFMIMSCAARGVKRMDSTALVFKSSYKRDRIERVVKAEQSRICSSTIFLL